MPVVLSVLWGLAAGPLIHHVAVQAGADAPFAWSSGLCRTCGAPGSTIRSCPGCGRSPARSWATAAGAAAASGGVAWALGPRWILIAYLFFVAMSASLFLTDLDHKRIPNRITYPGTPIAAGLLMAGAALDGTASHLPRALGGAAVYTLVFLVVYLAARGGFGFGDVKLAISLGLFTGFLGWDRLLLSGMLTAAAGGVIALLALLVGRAGARTEIPYGPPMIIGSLGAIIFGGPSVGFM